MSFPASPENGEIYEGYKYDSSQGAWIIINEYDSEGNLEVEKNIILPSGNSWIGKSNSQSDPNIEFEPSGIEITGGGVVIGGGGPPSSGLEVNGPLLINGDPVIESGSNSDGEWTRWSDGTQICWHRLEEGTSSVDTPRNWTYPKPFYSSPRVFATAEHYTNTDDHGRISSPQRNYTSTTNVDIYIWRIQIPNDSTSVESSVSAYGRWK